MSEPRIDPQRVYTFAEVEELFGRAYADRLRRALGMPSAAEQRKAAGAAAMLDEAVAAHQAGRGRVPRRRAGEPEGRLGDQVAVQFSGRRG